MTEICDRTLRRQARRCSSKSDRLRHAGARQSVRHAGRVALGMGAEDVSELREIGKLLAFLKEPEPPKGLKDAWSKLPIYKKVISMAPKVLKDAPCQEVIVEGDDVDLTKIPVQHWPGTPRR